MSDTEKTEGLLETYSESEKGNVRQTVLPMIPIL